MTDRAVGNEIQKSIDRFERGVIEGPHDDGYYYAHWWTIRGLVAWWLKHNANAAVLEAWKAATQ